MTILFEPPRIQKDFEDIKKNIKKYGKDFAEKLEMMLAAILYAESALDLYSLPQYKMHMLHGNLQGVYSLSPDNKKTKWRILAICIDENGNECKPNEDEQGFLSNIKTVKLMEVSEHYE